MIELIRKLLLFALLFVVGVGSYLVSRNSTDWQEPLWVQIYPLNADGRSQTQEYIQQLQRNDFLTIDEFMREQRKRYAVDIEQPVKIILGEEIPELPPATPTDGGILEIIIWSLKLRWWAGSVTSEHEGPQPDIKLFLLYFDPDTTPVLGHSLGLEKGLIGIVNVFAARSQNGTNNFVATHEMLHTLGATDKYKPGSNMPSFPDGYAEPEQRPRFPQRKAEIMGGRIPLSATTAEIPSGLKEAVIGPATAAEINWLRD